MIVLPSLSIGQTVRLPSRSSGALLPRCGCRMARGCSRGQMASLQPHVSQTVLRRANRVRRRRQRYSRAAARLIGKTSRLEREPSLESVELPSRRLPCLPSPHHPPPSSTRLGSPTSAYQSSMGLLAQRITRLAPTMAATPAFRAAVPLARACRLASASSSKAGCSLPQLRRFSNGVTTETVSDRVSGPWQREDGRWVAHTVERFPLSLRFSPRHRKPSPGYSTRWPRARKSSGTFASSVRPTSLPSSRSEGRS